jgi:hypothetical protein
MPGVFDFSDHTLTQISTWAEVGILLFMLWEKYGPNLLGRFGRRPVIGRSTELPHGFFGRLWANRTIVVAIIGLGIVGWLYSHQDRTTPAATTADIATTQSKLDAATTDLGKRTKHSSYDSEVGSA